MALQNKTCVLTGANGFVGSRLRQTLQADGWRIIPWTRHPEPGTQETSFRLGQKVDPSGFKGIQALLHCAYDFDARKWEDIAAVSVAGSEELFRAARQAGVKTVVFISTLSAFEGCRSDYGRAKLQIERLASTQGAFIIRPGLVYSEDPGGVFGRLVHQVRKSRLVPLIWGGSQTQYLVHAEDLGKLVLGCLDGQCPPTAEPISAAHEQGWELKEILRQIARTQRRRIYFLPVPWRLAWMGLRASELAGRPTRFRSDSLISIVYQNPRPDFALVRSLGFPCRPFRLTSSLLASAAG